MICYGTIETFVFECWSLLKLTHDDITCANFREIWELARQERCIKCINKPINPLYSSWWQLLVWEQRAEVVWPTTCGGWWGTMEKEQEWMVLWCFQLTSAMGMAAKKISEEQVGSFGDRYSAAVMKHDNTFHDTLLAERWLRILLKSKESALQTRLRFSFTKVWRKVRILYCRSSWSE